MLTALSIEMLRRRKSEKWSTYPPDILPAFVAESDFAPPQSVMQALHEAIESTDLGYAAASGELSDALAAFAAVHFDWKLDPSRVFAVADVMLGVEQVVALYTVTDDSIVINPPVYPPFFEVIRASGRRICEVPLLSDAQSWQLDFDALESAFAAGARAYLLCNPHNPVGRVWGRDELMRIAALAERYGVTVISDEIHAPLTLGDARFTPYLAVTGECERAFAAHSTSKAWNTAGLKCATLVAGSAKSAEILARRWREQPSETSWRVGHLGAIASVAAWNAGNAWLDALRDRLTRNRSLLRVLLAQYLPQVAYIEPQATYLVWLDCRVLGLGPNPSAAFLERGRVALSSGLDFGQQGAGYIRLNMGTSPEILTEIVQRMSLALPEQDTGQYITRQHQ